jgi:hypothetical protein
MKHLLFVIHCSLLLVLLSGCGKGIDANYVEGTITLDGKPLPGASITFFVSGDDTKTAGGFSDENGRYRITPQGGTGGEGAKDGNYQVTASKAETVPLPKPVKYDDGTVSTETTKQVLPAVYQNRQKTPLKAEVKKGKNKIDFALESNPK